MGCASRSQLLSSVGEYNQGAFLAATLLPTYTISYASPFSITPPVTPQHFARLFHNSLTYLIMRPHRFAFNFGYGFDANDAAMTGVAFLFASMFLELGLEVVIDSAALGIEQMHGINVDKFWEMWQVNPGNFFGVHLCSTLNALAFGFWAFTTLPTPVFCTSQHDPCSCKGGGFQIFKPFCDAAAATVEEAEATQNFQSNATNSSGNGTSAIPENAYVDTDCT